VAAKPDLLLSVLRAFEAEGLLKELILIGSWTHLLYAKHFHHPPEIPAIRTLDLDFLVLWPKLLRREVDIPTLLANLDFREAIDPHDGVVKYVHPDLELEILVPLTGPIDKKPAKIPKLKTTAQKLRYLDVLGHTIMVAYKGLKIKVPDPAAYILQKLLIQDRREPDKKAKDMEAIEGIGRFLLRNRSGKKTLGDFYTELPPGWQKKILAASKAEASELHKFLVEL